MFLKGMRNGITVEVDLKKSTFKLFFFFCVFEFTSIRYSVTEKRDRERVERNKGGQTKGER